MPRLAADKRKQDDRANRVRELAASARGFQINISMTLESRRHQDDVLGDVIVSLFSVPYFLAVVAVHGRDQPEDLPIPKLVIIEYQPTS